MWQSPSRARALANQRKRERGQSPIHLKRVKAEIKSLEQADSDTPLAPSDARLLLNDLSVDGIGLFASKSFIVGQKIALVLDHPKSIEIKGKIAWCQEVISESHIMSDAPFPFRLGIEFCFESPEEKKQLEAYCETLAKDYLYTNKAA
jgi:Tfp pilus assembly protein PilZ